MRTMKLGASDLTVPVVAVGCMRMNSLDRAAAKAYVAAALEGGANFFDHADIYAGGASEEIFAEAVGMTSAVREKLILQSKCGIVPGKMFDFSKEHILASVEGILKRLKTDYLDVLLLHRPDALMEPEEVAAAFDALYAAGKVRHFGVSNQNPMQIELLKKSVRQPLVVNQLQFSAAFCGMVSAGLHVNMQEDASVDRDGQVLDYCRLHDVTIQAWSPFQHGFFGGVFLGDPQFPALNAEIDKLAARHAVSPTTIALAWILRHPAKLQPIVGTMNKGRLADCIRAASVTLSREEWYSLYMAAGNTLP